MELPFNFSTQFNVTNLHIASLLTPTSWSTHLIVTWFQFPSIPEFLPSMYALFSKSLCLCCSSPSSTSKIECFIETIDSTAKSEWLAPSWSFWSSTCPVSSKAWSDWLAAEKLDPSTTSPKTWLKSALPITISYIRPYWFYRHASCLSSSCLAYCSTTSKKTQGHGRKV
jgi:hypothetical protein